MRLPLATLCLLFLQVASGQAVSRSLAADFSLSQGTRVALVGNSTAERLSRYGHLETRIHLRQSAAPVSIRNFGWPADEVGVQRRPGNYTKIDDPLEVFGPQAFFCFFGCNESFQGTELETVDQFKQQYRDYLDRMAKSFSTSDRAVTFLLFTPIAFESTGHPLQPAGVRENERLDVYRKAVLELAAERQLPAVDLFEPTRALFARDPGAQFTTNGLHLNEAGDRALAEIIEAQLYGEALPDPSDRYESLRDVVNDKAWLHRQDYRMLNGWYVYGGRRTWDTETFPTEYRKIRNMVAAREQRIWDLASGNQITGPIDDANTGDVVIPATMFGSRDDNFRKMREPKTLDYPTPEESIAKMKVPDGFEVQLFASEREFPELANPNQLAFDDQGRLWVSCMVNYPQWLPGSARPSDRLLIFEDTDGDGKADQCKTFYDKLICPTGFEFYKDGVVVVDEPSILFLRDTDGDDVADEVTELLDGIGTEDTHHAMGAWEYSHGGRLHMLEGIAMSTTLETPWGPIRKQGKSGSYVWDLESQRLGHFLTPGQYNPWCLIFDVHGNGIVGDGTNAQHHWANALSGGEVRSRKSLEPVFNNHGIRPAVG
ncbi:MAG: PVC-type heme-binding CxxCH protein, partial [Planctomycetota bacterium]